MDNRRYNNYGRRRRFRVTGRFYAFLTVVLVLCVMVGVLIANRSRVTTPPATTYNPPVLANNQPVVQPQQSPQPQESQVPVVQGQTSPENNQAEPVIAGPDDPGQVIEPDAGTIEEYDANAEDPEVEIQIGDEAMDTSNLSVTQGLDSNWRNILLLGTDTRNINKVNRTDTIIIASVNSSTGEIKLTSIMRDLIVPMTKKNGKEVEDKINSVIAYGGPDGIMKKVNELFGMNITEYVLVNFASFQKVVDILGGIEMDVTAAEKDEINKSLGEQAKVAGMDQQVYLDSRSDMELKVYGPGVKLTGTQALAYARIRHVGSGDYQRTERQRHVLEAILKKAKKANLAEIGSLAMNMWGEIQTNIDMFSAISLATGVISNGGNMTLNGRIPGKNTFKSETRNKKSALWDCDFEANKQLLYAYIYGA